MKPLKVLAVITNFGRHGAGMTLKRFLESLDDSRISLELCAVSGEGPEIDRFRASGIPIHIMKESSRFDPVIIWRLRNLIKRGGYDLVYTAKHRSAFVARPAAYLAGTPVLVHERGSPLQFISPPVLLADRLLSKGSHLVVANSQFTADTTVAVLGIAPDRIRVVYNPVPSLPEPMERPVIRKGEAPVLGFFGRLAAVKGVDILIRAMIPVLAKYPGATVRITGEGPLLSSLRKLAEDQGVSKAVEFHPWEEDTLPSMSQVDLVVVPSLHESFGNVVTEAALARTPVVAAHVGGIPEILDVVKHGITVAPRLSVDSVQGDWKPMAASVKRFQGKGLLAVEPGALAKAILELWDDSDRRRDMVAESFQQVSRSFSSTKYVNNLIKVMLEAAGRSEDLPNDVAGR